MADHPNGRGARSYIVVSPSRDRRAVEVWSAKRLPFEPSGWLRDLRSDIRNAVRGLAASSATDILYAAYASDVTASFDVENVLFYNVGSGAFSAVARSGVQFERVFSAPPEPPDAVEGEEMHYHFYSLSRARMSFRNWRAGGRLAQWSAECERLASDTAAAAVWYSMKQGQLVAEGDSGGKSGYILLRIVIDGPGETMMNATSIIKPICDGVIAAMHSHDGSDLVEVSRRVAAQVRTDSQHVAKLLMAEGASLLGRRRLLYLRGRGVQWNPADDRLVACELVLKKSAKPGAWRISGELFEAESTSILKT